MPNIMRSKDQNKDQSYFVWQIKKNQIPHILFPIGEFDSKSDVRDYAKSKNLITSSKSDSQGLCFVGQTPLRKLLLEVIGKKPGKIVTFLTKNQLESIGLKSTSKNNLSHSKYSTDDTPLKILLGEHEGAFLYTIGQRQNLGISNGPWFVSSTDIKSNEVTVCHIDFEKPLENSIIIVKDCNWHLDLDFFVSPRFVWEKELLNSIDGFDSRINDFLNKINTNDDKANFGYYIIDCKVQIRYRSQAISCRVFLDAEDNQALIKFLEPVKSIAKGQSAVFYSEGGQLLGGSIIDDAI